MLAAFTDAAAAQLPGLADDGSWPGQVRVAGAAWTLSITGWLLSRAQGSDASIGPPGRESPNRQQLLTHRWGWVARELAWELPAVAAVCDQAFSWAQGEWGASERLELPAYPPWR